MFFLFTVIVSVILGVIDSALGLTLGGSGARFGSNGILGSLFSLATILPSLAVGVRRLHDTDRSGWWLLMPFAIILVGLVLSFALGTAPDGAAATGTAFIVAMVAGGVSGVVLLVFFCLEGTRGANRFGEDPKGVAYDGVFE